MKDPAFLFYPNDWIGGTMGMTLEEKGAYMELLMMQFNRGHMTNDMIGQAVGQIFGRIKDKFQKDENGDWYNERLEKEQEKRKSYTASRSNNRSGKNQYTKNDEKKGGHMGGHMTYHMENVNVNEIIGIENKEKKDIGVVGEKEKKEKREKDIPSVENFCEFAKLEFESLNKNFSDYEYSVKAKYESWVENGWKDGNNNPIKNWKSKFKNSMQYLKPIFGSGKNAIVQPINSGVDKDFENYKLAQQRLGNSLI